MKRNSGMRGSRARYAILGGAIFIAAGVLIARLMQWQIIQPSIYAVQDESDTCTIYSPAVRGEIYDCCGRGLALNLTSYRVVMNRLFIRSGELNGTIERVTELLERCKEQWEDVLPIETDGKGGFAFSPGREDEAEELRERDDLGLDGAMDAEECIERLAEHYGCEDFAGEVRRRIVSVRYDMDRTGFCRSQPYIIAKNISQDSMQAVNEIMKDEEGVYAEAYAVRTYTEGSAAPAIVGITGLISQEEYAVLKDRGYAYNDIIGKSGIEDAFEKELRGTGGSRKYSVDENGRAVLVREENAAPGNSVCLTIDLELQKAAQKALEEAVTEANEYAARTGDADMGADCKGAAAVVIRISDFAVLCAAGYPTYDLEEYYDRYEELVSDERAPLFDRAFAGALAPGSTFKPLTACSALEEKKISPGTKIECTGVYTAGGLRLWCMGFHGEQDVKNALMNSCNVFFSEAGRRLGTDLLDSYARRFGLGVKTGVEIYESEGTLAGPEYSAQTGGVWRDSSVSPAAIGQSDNQFTPLQLAVYAATIANGGRRLRAHVVDRVVRYGTDETVFRTEPELVEETGVSAENIRTVQQGMLMGAQSYSALEGFPIKTGGKTGTAENGGSDHANFICFAPYDKPEIAVAVMVEHGAKSFVAVNAARKIMEKYFGV